MATFLVSGLWHGANWTFVIWGALHGLFQIVEKALFEDTIKKEIKQGKNKLTAIRVFRILITFNIVSLAWIFFRMPTLKDALAFIFNIIFEFGSFHLAPLDIISITSLGVALPLLILKDVHDEYFVGKNNEIEAPWLKWIFYIIVFCIMISMGVLDSGQFIYVNF